VQLPAFLIGRYPVTNGEFACFLAAGGYQEKAYWPSEEGRAWLRGEGESGALAEAMRVWWAVRSDPALLGRLRRAGVSPRGVGAWETLAGLGEEEARAVLGQAREQRPRDRPAFWDDAQFNNPAQPVVGVGWHEALAYCCWLTEKMQEAGTTFRELTVWRDGKPAEMRLVPGSFRICLPSEAEWERAARGQRGRTYPWGVRWDAARANTWEGHVLRPTPVGVYPDGITPEGVHDLSGNVWEWTRSLYCPYPYLADDGREALGAEGYRVVRGGSWGHAQRGARCASRYRLIPDSFNGSLGFRVVVSLAGSES
jgi:formylglycine-generating enzyme required for sulfatase activity